MEYNFSLTNYVEIIIINSILIKNTRNQINLFPFTEETKLSQLSGQMVSRKNYIPHIGRLIDERIITSTANFDDYVLRKYTYFLINKELNLDDSKLYNLYSTLCGTSAMGSIYFPQKITKFPLQMPSRHRVFR